MLEGVLVDDYNGIEDPYNSNVEVEVENVGEESQNESINQSPGNIGKNKV